MKEGEALFLEHARLCRKYGAAVVVMAFDEQGQADSYERRVEICERAYRLLVDEVGFPPEDIIFDPNVFAVATGMDEHANNALDFFRATKWIRTNLSGAHVSGGVSNVSFSFRGTIQKAIPLVAVIIGMLFIIRGLGLDIPYLSPSNMSLFVQSEANCH